MAKISGDIPLCTCGKMKRGIQTTDEVLQGVETSVLMEAGNNNEFTCDPPMKRKRLDQSKPEITLIKQWEDTSNFKQEWLNQIKTYQSRFVPTSLLTKDNQIWLTYKFNTQNPKFSTFLCRFCNAYVKGKNIANAPMLSRDEGYYTPNYHRMWKQISLHSQSEIHKRSIASSMENYATSLKQCLQQTRNLQLEKNLDYEVTMRMVRTEYTEIRLNIPFSSHSDVIFMQKANGASLGTRHIERSSATRIMESISYKMHDSLVKYLIKSNLPFSIIVDTSTDQGNRNFFYHFNQIFGK
jgi:hypothetical protein